jgi:hypothetical protein
MQRVRCTSTVYVHSPHAQCTCTVRTHSARAQSARTVHVHSPHAQCTWHTHLLFAAACASLRLGFVPHGLDLVLQLLICIKEKGGQNLRIEIKKLTSLGCPGKGGSAMGERTCSPLTPYWFSIIEPRTYEGVNLKNIKILMHKIKLLHHLVSDLQESMHTLTEVNKTICIVKVS